MHALSSTEFEFSLKPRRHAGLFLALTALIALAGIAETVKVAVVAAMEASDDATIIQKAVAIDPANPALHNRLAQMYGDAADPSNLAAALREARRATVLNPNKADYWLALASACEAMNDSGCADHAVQQALNLSPMVPQDWWIAANHYLREDRPDAALACFHRLLQLSPDYDAPTFALALRAYADPTLILDKVVGDASNPQIALAFTDFMSANDQFDAAREAWTRIASGSAHFPFAAVQPYLERLLAHGQFQDAYSLWSNLEARGVITKPQDSDPSNLVYNGGFEQQPLEAGFDWRQQPSTFVSVDFADPSPRAGQQCLRLDFPVGENDEFEPVYQVVPVVPHQSYSLAAQVRSSDITSDSGPRVRVIDASCPTCLDVATDPTIGTTPWHEVKLNFASGAQTRAVRISVWRLRSRVFPMEISGTFWLDAVSLRAEHPF